MRAVRYALLALLIAAAGCSKEKNVDPPAKLVGYAKKLAVKKIWSEGVGGDKKHLRLGLGPALDAGIVYAASHGGDVVAVDLASGRRLWRTDTKLPLSGGPGAGAGLVVVGASKGNLVALEAATGKQRWRTRINGELLAAPAISELVVVVRSVDGKLRGLNAADGKELWQLEQPVPKLSLRGTAAPVIAKDMAIVGFDNGKLMAVTLASGDTVWDSALSAPRGKTELDRLVDIDSAVQCSGDDVYAVGFQGRVAMLALDSGQVWWGHDFSSVHGVGIDDTSLYLADTTGSLFALGRRDGAERWHSDKLKRRGLSAPVATSTAVAVGDFEGYVHWFDKVSGEIVARERAGGGAIRNAPVASNDTVIVLTDKGELAAFRAKSPQ
jgi:outer membrane protein assembly factor BamB